MYNPTCSDLQSCGRENNVDISNIISHFSIKGQLSEIHVNREGHINNTFVCTFTSNGVSTKYTLQHINRKVFSHPEEVMENIQYVTDHIKNKIKHLVNCDQRCLSLVPAKTGERFFIDEEGEYWRVYRYIEHVRTFNTICESSQAFLFGQAVGAFQNQLSDFDGRKLHITIPDFHNMAFRYAQLSEACTIDCKGRLKLVGPELEFLEENRQRGLAIWDGMKKGLFPTRVTHNDTKMNNVLFSEDGKEALCIIDLDTVMPGTILFDTGDMIRTAVNTAAEDEKDLSKVACDKGLYHALIEGYRQEAVAFLTEDETSNIKESGRNITQIMAVRFLTDYLNGDVYYQIEKPEHNLDRARTQIALMKSMDRSWHEL
ncbi:MAG: phosphotransferase [Sphaerochaetaceae bacterium]